jgi:hypothetical protein
MVQLVLIFIGQTLISYQPLNTGELKDYKTTDSFSFSVVVWSELLRLPLYAAVGTTLPRGTPI